MKGILALTLVLLSFSASANYKWELERNVKILARQVDALASQNASLLNVSELRTSIRKLKDLKLTLLGLDRRYPTKDDSINNWLWALPSWGETLHNNHHKRPYSWSHGEKWWELDVGAWIVKLIKVD